MYRKMKLKDICTIITDGSHYSPESFEFGYPIASVKDMHNYGIDINTCRKISKIEFDNLVKNNCMPMVDDVLIAKDGSYLKHAFVVKEPINYVVLSSIGIFRPDKNIVNPYYLKYLFLNESFRRYVTKGFVSGTALKRIVLKAFKEIKVNIPDLTFQNEVVDRILPLDNLIENNNKLIEELKEYSQLLFYKWFVDFNFPNEEGKPYKDNGGKMHTIGKKEIPYKWTFKSIDEIVTDIIDHRGKTPKKLGGDWVDEGIVALSAKSVKGGHLINLEKANKVSQEMYYKWMKNELRDGDILMTSEAPLGEFYYIIGEEKYCLSQRLFALRANKEIVYPSYFYLELSQSRGKKKIVARQSGSTVFGIRQEELRKVEILLPEMKIQKQFDEIVSPILEKIRQCEQLNRILEETRDLLIKKLIK